MSVHFPGRLSTLQTGDELNATNLSPETPVQSDLDVFVWCGEWAAEGCPPSALQLKSDDIFDPCESMACWWPFYFASILLDAVDVLIYPGLMVLPLPPLLSCPLTCLSLTRCSSRIAWKESRLWMRGHDCRRCLLAVRRKKIWLKYVRYA